MDQGFVLAARARNLVSEVGPLHPKALGMVHVVTIDSYDCSNLSLIFKEIKVYAYI